MKQFFSFVRKEFYHIFRDRRTMLILLGMPVVQIILFGFAITTEVHNCRVAVLDPSSDVTTQRLIERIEANPYFTIVKCLDNPGQLDGMFQRNEIDLALVFRNHLEADLYGGQSTAIQIQVDATDPNTSSMMVTYMQGILASAFGNQGPPPVQVETRLLYNPQMKSAYNFVPGVMGLILMLLCTMMTSISIVREKEMGTMEVLLVSPIKPIYIILAKAIPYFLLSCCNLITILVLSVWVLKVPVLGSLWWLFLLSVVFISVSLALGLLISTIVDNQVAAMLVSGMAMMMPVLVLSGMIFPVKSMPEFLQWVSNIVPARWYISAVRKVMIQGLGVSYFIKELSILILMAVGLVGLSLKAFKNRLN